MTTNWRELVDVDRGEISRQIFHDEEIYRQELQNIFGRAWLYVGHESQIKGPGDYFLSRMGEESVILTRDQDGTVHVFLNSCRHKGMKICRYDEGNTKIFYCPYHAWSYALDGRLLGVPEYERAYRSSFDKKDWGLIRVAQVATFRGTIWATWDHDAPPFEEYLGEARDALWLGLGPWDAGDGEVELFAGVQKWIVPCNWKFAAENFGGDPLHNVSHRSADLARIGPNADVGRRDPLGEIFLSYYPEGHGFIYEKIDVTKPRNHYSSSPVTSQYYEEAWRRRLGRIGAKAGSPAMLGNIYPNTNFMVQQPRSICVAHPRGPATSELWRVYFVDKNAPDEAKAFLRRFYLSYGGPGGMTEQDDMENWGYASQGCRSGASRAYPFNYKAGLGMQHRDRDITGTVSDNFQTEQNNRQFYRRWAQYMSAGSWSDLACGDAR